MNNFGSTLPITSDELCTDTWLYLLGSVRGSDVWQLALGQAALQPQLWLLDLWRGPIRPSVPRQQGHLCPCNPSQYSQHSKTDLRKNIIKFHCTQPTYRYIYVHCTLPERVWFFSLSLLWGRIRSRNIGFVCISTVAIPTFKEQYILSKVIGQHI